MTDEPAPQAGPCDLESGTICSARAAPRILSAADCPIESIHAAHFTLRQLCADMEVLATTEEPRPDLARRILVSLCRDLPAHIDDEQHGLFPLLRARALPEDELEKTLLCLSRDHEISERAFALLVPALACMADGGLPTPEERSALERVAASERRHLIVENAILLPLARLRLTEADKAALLGQMQASRNRLHRVDTACARALERLDPGSLGRLYER